MRFKSLMAGSVVAVLSVAGCNSSNDKTTAPEIEKKVEAPKPADDKKAKEAAAVAKATYHEVTHDGRIYVMASDETAAGGAKGKHPAMSVTKIGYGPKGETVVFEASEGGGVEKKLIEAFKAKYKMN
ncbi:hypothetical protein [Humisphaera borealis]|uniref:Lipoprotein n=1 Tax=Humisphaera borealis TaxID=2807512 RepID=A0A7M2WZU6_9BACT|nr:hypothetical protein [Humisphaera borealis]QOV90000.1 hypothetical protein IPV69_01100 [Humisphaera borealis]